MAKRATRPSRSSARRPPPGAMASLFDDEVPRAPPAAPPAPPDVSGKRPFDIDEMILLLREAVADLTPAAMFQLRDEGYGTLFEVLVGCIISIRTLDEITLTTTRRLLDVARTPRQIAALSPERIDDLISACTFHEPKARTIHAIAVETLDRFGDELPCDFDVLAGFKGVGPKCANLALGVACDQPHGVAVDIHVHRVTNRWGYVSAPTPEKTMVALERVLPKKYWIEINKLLVPFGKAICTGNAPRCSRCALLAFCRQVDVGAHR